MTPGFDRSRTINWKTQRSTAAECVSPRSMLAYSLFLAQFLAQLLCKVSMHTEHWQWMNSWGRPQFHVSKLIIKHFESKHLKRVEYESVLHGLLPPRSLDLYVLHLRRTSSYSCQDWPSLCSQTWTSWKQSAGSARGRSDRNFAPQALWSSSCHLGWGSWRSRWRLWLDKGRGQDVSLGFCSNFLLVSLLLVTIQKKRTFLKGTSKSD